jgi:hypothetical protein
MVFLYSYCLFVYRYSNLFFKQKVYEDGIGYMLVQEQSDIDTSDEEKNCKWNVVTKDIEQVWWFSVGIIVIIFDIIKYLCFSIRQYVRMMNKCWEGDIRDLL